MMWKMLMFAETEAKFNHIWQWILDEFKEQDDLLDYVLTSWFPWKEQWAEYLVRFYLNFGQCVTSQTEASNFNIKSYLISGKADWRLTKALQEMCENQARSYNQAVSAQETSVKQDYLHRYYLGDLPMAVSHRALDLINKEKRHAEKLLLERAEAEKRGEGEEFPVPQCKDDCSMWLQYRLPCRHTIFQRIKDGEKLTLQDLDPRWLLDGRIDANSRYLRIQDPPEAENRRGRPKNKPIAVNWEFYLPGSGQGDAQPQDEAAPRAGRGGEEEPQGVEDVEELLTVLLAVRPLLAAPLGPARSEATLPPDGSTRVFAGTSRSGSSSRRLRTSRRSGVLGGSARKLPGLLRLSRRLRGQGSGLVEVAEYVDGGNKVPQLQDGIPGREMAVQLF
jgi:hypothetical protein